jgi:hypothetical protein
VSFGKLKLMTKQSKAQVLREQKAKKVARRSTQRLLGVGDSEIVAWPETSMGADGKHTFSDTKKVAGVAGQQEGLTEAAIPRPGPAAGFGAAGHEVAAVEQAVSKQLQKLNLPAGCVVAHHLISHTKSIPHPHTKYTGDTLAFE